MKHVFMLHDVKKHHDFEKVIHEVMKDHDYEIFYSCAMADSIHHIRQYPKKARFYAVGGDGTCNGLIQALVNTEHEVVILPLGTGNDFCRMMTKERDPKVLLQRSLSLSACKVDTILMNDRYYLNSACFGVDSTIANHVHDIPDIPLVPESKSYLVSIAQHVFQYPFDEVTLMSEGKCLYKGRVTLCTLNNGQYYGGGFLITPDANIEDGYIDICIVDRIAKAKIPYMFLKLLAHKIDNLKQVHYFRVKEASIQCENHCNIDGEETSYDHYDFQIQPLSLNLVRYED